jgi:hypothetical protein
LGGFYGDYKEMKKDENYKKKYSRSWSRWDKKPKKIAR